MLPWVSIEPGPLVNLWFQVQHSPFWANLVKVQSVFTTVLLRNTLEILRTSKLSVVLARFSQQRDDQDAFPGPSHLFHPAKEKEGFLSIQPVQVSCTRFRDLPRVCLGVREVIHTFPGVQRDRSQPRSQLLSEGWGGLSCCQGNCWGELRACKASGNSEKGDSPEVELSNVYILVYVGIIMWFYFHFVGFF